MRKFTENCCDAERAMLACLLMGGWIEGLEEEDFGEPENRWIFSEIKALNELGEPITDPVAVHRWFISPKCKAAGQRIAGIEGSDLTVLIYEIMREYTTQAHIEYYGGVLRAERLCRWLDRIGYKIIKMNADNPNTPVDTYWWLREQTLAITEIINSIPGGSDGIVRTQDEQEAGSHPHPTGAS